MTEEPPIEHPDGVSRALAQVVSIQVGMPREHARPQVVDPDERTWRSAIVKEPIDGPVWVGREGLEGDGQAARPAHGGPDRAVLGYAAAHYDAWRRELPDLELPFGGFGENLTIAGLTEDTVCLGDLVRIGGTLLEVSVPRTPCAALNRRFGIDDLLERVRTTLRFGWFYRVLEEGVVGAGDEARLIERRHPHWSMARVFTLMTRIKERDAAWLEEGAALAACPQLAIAWREHLQKRLEMLKEPER